jgi:hypothetical protein
MFSGGVCLQATPSSGRRIRFCALTISEECTNRGPSSGVNRRRAGEDAHVSIKRARGRRLSIEGRDLDAEFTVVVPAPQGPVQAPGKYDGSSNPSEFLQVYITAITAAGGNDAVMASYFHVALTGPARTWLMNLTPGSIRSWGELCTQFTANFASAYQQHGVEAHLHAVRQQPRETLRAFISDASIITAFRQGVRDEKMLEKLATHQVETVTTLFALADKCARAAEGRAWHSSTQAGPSQMSGPSVADPGSGKKKNKKSRGFDKPRIGGLAVAAATTGGQNPRGKRPRQQRTDPESCPVHPRARHSATKCREIQKLAERLSKRRNQASREGSPPSAAVRQGEGLRRRCGRSGEGVGVPNPQQGP